jgi:hypothetical protein
MEIVFCETACSMRSGFGLVRRGLAYSRRFSSDDQSSTTTIRRRIEASTQKWFETIVVGQKLCPFASSVKLRTVVVVATDKNDNDICGLDGSRQQQQQQQQAVLDDTIRLVAREAKLLLSGHEPHETTLIVFDNDARFVNEFRDLVRLSWTLQQEVVVKQGYLKSLQLVLFHCQF